MPGSRRTRSLPPPIGVVVNAADGNAPEAADALESLGQTYWYPLHAYIRRCGYRPEDAQDLTQSFFARLHFDHALLNSPTFYRIAAP